MTISRLRVAAKPNANANHPTTPPTVIKHGCRAVTRLKAASTTRRPRSSDSVLAHGTRGHRVIVFSVGSCCVLVLFLFGVPVSRDVLECGDVSSPASGRVPRARAAGGPRHTPHVSLRVAHVSLTHVHTRFVLSIIAFPFARAPLHPSLPFLFFQTTDSDRDIRAERERERWGYIYCK